MKTEILQVVEERRNGTYVDESEASNRYKPMIQLTSVS